VVQNSGPLTAGAEATLSGAAAHDRAAFDAGLTGVVGALTKVNAVMARMWARSRPADYTSFRTFIFGITSQSMFPAGVVYEGVSKIPMSFRGESGANDSMVSELVGSVGTSPGCEMANLWTSSTDARGQIPLMDNLLAIPMPPTPLTAILQDFRAYRPGNHRAFLEWVKTRTERVDVFGFAMQERGSAALYLQALDQVRDFRWRHWCFTREYILKRTAHPTATGGSPIVTVSVGMRWFGGESLPCASPLHHTPTTQPHVRTDRSPAG
jgi:indoleamine 2,3-dioxygenase